MNSIYRPRSSFSICSWEHVSYCSLDHLASHQRQQDTLLSRIRGLPCYQGYTCNCVRSRREPCLVWGGADSRTNALRDVLVDQQCKKLRLKVGRGTYTVEARRRAKDRIIADPHKSGMPEERTERRCVPAFQEFSPLSPETRRNPETLGER
ncbi:hypothetical protein MPH_00709 [Macrophomina phaseolina MS6]|uniref:Uncharacterized protein n=1 Tax=Macrophomina phaseolina (strain MS6) TaxID=1126212 RepID=K2SYU4_MACPH|nr:hypothetical protein MPH_00709 [Macrophomina phaseolina MS6]